MSFGQIYIFIHYSSLFLKIKKLCPNDRDKCFKMNVLPVILTKGAVKGHYGSCWTRTSAKRLLVVSSDQLS